MSGDKTDSEDDLRVNNHNTLFSNRISLTACDEIFSSSSFKYGQQTQKINSNTMSKTSGPRLTGNSTSGDSCISCCQAKRCRETRGPFKKQLPLYNSVSVK
jgi:hypothetical protein